MNAPEILITPSQKLERERKINSRLHQHVQDTMNEARPIPDRSNSWKKALESVVEKGVIKTRANQVLRPAEYQEPLIDRSPIDDRILEAVSPELKKLTESGTVNPQAIFAITEYFSKTGYHNLTSEQAVELAKCFPQKQQTSPFDQYKKAAEEDISNKTITGKNPSESWVMRREIMDILEISDLITKSYYKSSIGKTVYISDLIKVAVEGLRMVHQSSTEAGHAELNVKDKIFLRSQESSRFRNIKNETVIRLLRNPFVLLSLMSSNNPRSFENDMGKIFKSNTEIQIEGEENIPAEGSCIVAFSHAERWRDPQVASYWEKVALVSSLQKRRRDKKLSLVAYINYFKETAPNSIKSWYKNAVDGAAEKLKTLYGINVIDIDPRDRAKMKNFQQQSEQILNSGGLILISPEGLPAPEVLKPQRGFGLLAHKSKAPVVGAAFVEDKLPNGKFVHKLIFTPPRRYTNQIPGASLGDKHQAFADQIMRDIASNMPLEQRGVFR